jgi:hypothetical protein
MVRAAAQASVELVVFTALLRCKEEEPIGLTRRNGRRIDCRYIGLHVCRETTAA